MYRDISKINFCGQLYVDSIDWMTRQDDGSDKLNITSPICSCYCCAVPIEIIQPVSKYERVKVGSRIEIKCKADFHTRVAWYFADTRPLVHEVGGVMIVSGVDTQDNVSLSSLLLEGAVEVHSGKYRCQNVLDSTDSDSVTVIIGEPDLGESSYIYTMTEFTRWVLVLWLSWKWDRRV